MNNFKKVSKDEFYKFIADYPNKDSLSTSTSTICEPPIRHYRDSSLKTEGEIGSADYFFDQEVARIVLDYMAPDGSFVSGPEYYEYKIRVF